MRRPALFSCSKRFASNRPWWASASKGESAGGTSPVRGLGRSQSERLLELFGGSNDWDRNSRPPGRLGGGIEVLERNSRPPGRSGRFNMVTGSECGAEVAVLSEIGSYRSERRCRTDGESRWWSDGGVSSYESSETVGYRSRIEAEVVELCAEVCQVFGYVSRYRMIMKGRKQRTGTRAVCTGL